MEGDWKIRWIRTLLLEGTLDPDVVAGRGLERTSIGRRLEGLDPEGDWKDWIWTFAVWGLEGMSIGRGCSCWKIIRMKLLEVDRIRTSIGRVGRDGDWTLLIVPIDVVVGDIVVDCSERIVVTDVVVNCSD